MDTKQKSPATETAMLIRKPVSEVFNAFIDPEITTKFWFTKSTGKLEKGKKIEWVWEMYDFTSYVEVIDILPNKKIEIEWRGKDGPATRVEWTFTSHGHYTFVNIVNDGFEGDQEDIIKQVNGSTGGFTWVLAGLKAYLEHNILMNYIKDRFPGGKPE